MRTILIALLLVSLNISAQNWKVSITPTNLAFNSLTVGIEKDNWENVIFWNIRRGLGVVFDL